MQQRGELIEKQSAHLAGTQSFGKDVRSFCIADACWCFGMVHCCSHQKSGRKDA